MTIITTYSYNRQYMTNISTQISNDQSSSLNQSTSSHTQKKHTKPKNLVNKQVYNKNAKNEIVAYKWHQLRNDETRNKDPT